MMYRKNCIGRWACALMVALNAGAIAAPVQPLHEQELDAIFSQVSFGLDPIDIRFNPEQLLTNDAWLKIETDSTYAKTISGTDGFFDMTLASRPLAKGKSIPLFYVDDFLTDGVSSNVVGMAWIESRGVAVKASVQADLVGVDTTTFEKHRQYAASIVAHEISHNLGLTHVDDFNLMSASAGDDSFSSMLTSDQVDQILSSSFVQMDSQGRRFISITPFAIAGVASVPEPASWQMFCAALLMGVPFFRSRRS